jgi:hypothetical protein
MTLQEKIEKKENIDYKRIKLVNWFFYNSVAINSR